MANDNNNNNNNNNNNDRQSYMYANNGSSSSSSSTAVDPGPWLLRLTIGYLIFLVLSLYPLITLVRKFRKRRKFKSALARQNCSLNEQQKGVSTTGTLTSTSSAGSPASKGNRSNSSTTNYVAPTPTSSSNEARKRQLTPPPVVAIEMGTFVQHPTMDDKSDGRDRALLDLDEDEASVFVPVTLPVSLFF